MYKKAIHNISTIVLDEQTRLDLSGELLSFVMSSGGRFRSLLLSGEPGTGKSMLGKAIMDGAVYSYEFMSFDSPDDLRSAWREARTHEHAVLVYDGIDETPFGKVSNTKMLSCIKSEWDNSLQDSILFITLVFPSQLNAMPPEFICRFDAHIRLPLPGEAERRTLFRSILDGVGEEIEVPEFVIHATRGATGRDIKVYMTNMFKRLISQGGHENGKLCPLTADKWAKSFGPNKLKISPGRKVSAPS